MIKKIVWVLLPVALVTLLTACNNEKEQEQSSPKPATATTTNQQETLSYDQYWSLYTQMANDLKLPGYTKIGDEVSKPRIIIVDKSVTFGKRIALTESGDNQAKNPTQNRITYKGKDGVLYLELIYLKQNLGNDMLNFDGAPPEQVKDNPNANRMKEDILSYKNTLVKLTIISNDDTAVEPLKLIDATKEIVQYLSKL